MTRSILTLLFALVTVSVCFAQSEPAQLLQKPAANRTHIVFVYAGDLWIVPREGGDAKRLTTGVGIETNPIFSPDGATVAFTGEYDGNTDVYVVPAAGGVPKRLTYHPGADTAIGWTPDGKQVMFSSGRNSYSNFPRLFTTGMDGGFPTEVPLPVAVRGAYSPDGAFIAYQPTPQSQPDWKRYRGGQTSPIWIARLSDSSIEKLPRQNSNDTNPMWIGDKVYFLSDRSGAISLFAYDTKSKQVAQVIRHDGLDIKSASASTGGGVGVIAYEQFGAIHLFDLKSNRSQKVNIRVAADLLALRPRFERVGTRIFNSGISPTGARAVFEARGEIITVPAEKGDPRNLTNTVGVMERDPAWSPDGKWIAYFSDESGEYALHLREQTGQGEVKKIQLPPSFYFAPTWSPDSKKLAFYDKFHQVFYLDLAKGTPVKVDANPIGGPARTLFPVWSPDSKWIAYTRHLPNRLRAVFAYSIETGKSHQLTDGMSDALYADWDKSGKYLYFTASTNVGPGISFADLSSIAQQITRSVYAIVLRDDLPSPLAPESDEEKVQEVKSEGQGSNNPPTAPAQANAPAGARPPARREPDPVRIDLEGIDQRIIALPIPARNFSGLVAGKADIVYILEVPPAGAGPGGTTLHRYDLSKRRFDRLLDGVASFEVSANGEKALFRQGTNWRIVATATMGAPAGPAGPPGGAPAGAASALRVAEMEVYVDPQVEWRQMYNEAWRHQRDFFYDPGLHGLHLETFKKKYEPYLANVAHRADLNYLFTEMLNQLTVGHMFLGGGDQTRPNFVPGGLLGADYTIESGRYRFARVYNGENWNPNLRAPLTQPGVRVKAGEYLLAVKGRELRATDNIYQLFEATANKQIVIRVGPNPDGSGSREVTVVPVANEGGLRNLAWIEGNRRKVAELSGGKLAYVYMPDTANGGFTSFQRYFFAQTDKEGALIDERFNSGGLLSDYVVEHLSRQQLNRIAFREGEDWNTPAGAIYGPKAMLINENAGSGGDALPWYFKKLKIGPLIGKRTWGGLVGVNGTPPLMDGGGVGSPSSALYGLSGDWEVENVGVAPDIEVDFDPAAWRQGRDPQLEKAVQVLMEELKKNPRPKYPRPPYPNYHNGRTAEIK
jgi:tricorn protease